jgi:hypothetical protein
MVLSGLAADGFKIILLRLYAVCADDLPDPILELRDEFLSDRERLKAAFGGLHELCSPVGRSGHTNDVTVGLEVLDQFGHGLLGHLRAFGQNADRGTGVVQVLKDRSMRRTYRAMAALRQPDAARNRDARPNPSLSFCRWSSGLVVITRAANSGPPEYAGLPAPTPRTCGAGQKCGQTPSWD